MRKFIISITFEGIYCRNQGEKRTSYILEVEALEFRNFQVGEVSIELH